MDRAGKAIEQWKRERPDLDVSPMAVIGRLNEVSSLIARDRLAPLFARFGLQAGEFDVLATLRRSGSPYALTPTALYEATMVTSGAMTNRLDRLETSGLIQRGPHPNDRRGIIVRLSDKGLALIDEAVTAHVANEHQILSGLTLTERETLSRLLEKLISSVS
ncbi:MAG: MarR family transcriptional regulator [Mesorhizobium sp.]|uniref:MarR family winged helix-turn-helix transcriptional regulator n=1 Tax=unclassified Mesorhizobium TaxID=325217 RepID=UPI000FD370BF|nr:MULTISPECIES: MarR family transcriptional regulator [unclassified Mesorhizobium]RVD48728.1 MarR family transcriptional regulator [Mesorhizobium sp. M8A.F.Ca.ET.023.02.2.1]TGV10119.1 MarR family transcriptional regulator [Mesorhizobium sp. M8A.F.Ca.ET.173.01.1.1]RWC80929.1 MAG: MarR family transcriptional regulator [Mesorhizobium sp.]RWF47693.1 MAG: MarR family transcriptional regulator [Mesorhizobium sp.]TGP86180.1 MarR family transcriptional regulator [Mesorhizobium sp. M8A.F.Ca.ET.218.01.